MKDTKLKTEEKIKSFNEKLEVKSGANNTNPLKVKFVNYDLKLNESDEKDLVDFIVSIAQCGFQYNIVNEEDSERLKYG